MDFLTNFLQADVDIQCFFKFGRRAGRHITYSVYLPRIFFTLSAVIGSGGEALKSIGWEWGMVQRRAPISPQGSQYNTSGNFVNFVLLLLVSQRYEP